MPKKENVFDRINNQYGDFTLSEKKLADYVLGHKLDVQYMSISELADACRVGEATVSRFCRKLNTKGYNDFKLAVAKSVIRREKGDFSLQPGVISAEDESVTGLARNLYAEHTAAIAQTLTLVNPDMIEKAVDIIVSSNNVYCMGQGGSMILAMEAAHLMSTVLPNFHHVWDSHTQASTAALMTGNDALLFYSYSGSTKEIIDIINIAKKRGGRVILITRFLRSPGASLSDVVLQCGADESPLQLGSVAAKMAQLYITDILYHEVCKRDPQGTRENQESIANALAQKHI